MTTLDEAIKSIAQAESWLTEASRLVSRLIDDVKVEKADDGSNVQRGMLEDACRLYYGLDAAYSTMNDVRKNVGEQLDYLSRNVIPEVMSERGVRSVTLDDISKRFSTATRTSASMLNKEQAMDWLESVGAGDLIQPTVNASSLGSFCKEFLSEHHIDPPDCIKVSNLTYTSITSVKKKDN